MCADHSVLTLILIEIFSEPEISPENTLTA